MAIVPPAPPAALPTNLAPLPRLLAYTQSLGLERQLQRPKRGVPTLALALVWLVLAWRGSGRPEHLGQLDEPLLAALLGRARLPGARTLRRSAARFAARHVRAAVEAAYLAELPRREARPPDPGGARPAGARPPRPPPGRGAGRLRLHQPRLGRGAGGDRRPLHPRLRPLGPDPPAAGGAGRAATALAARGRGDPPGHLPLGRAAAPPRPRRAHARRPARPLGLRNQRALGRPPVAGRGLPPPLARRTSHRGAAQWPRPRPSGQHPPASQPGRRRLPPARAHPG